LPYHVVPAAASFLGAAGAAVGGQIGETLNRLAVPETGPSALQTLKGHSLYGYLNAILHNTISPTGLAAGYKANVIPGEAEATLDGRSLPGFNTEMVLAEIRAVLGEAFEFEITRDSPPVQSRSDTPLFARLAAALKRHDPHAAGVVPNMMTGGTDAKYLTGLGMATYGFAPIQLPPDLKFMELLHGHNERAPIAGLAWGIRVLYEVVKEHCEG
jgi:acetylornithine deacetylase/succinyl-diaminopimelate desuccinylase-like protein